MKSTDWRYVVAGFCIPINFILIFAGIVIGDPFAIVLGSISIGLVLIPILRHINEQKEKEKQEQKDDNSEATFRQTD
jgi:tetrahydromethanopterin S-methyltransferase subunit E